MPFVPALLFCLTALSQDKNYTPAGHASWIAGCMKTLGGEITQVESTDGDASATLGDLGRTLAEERRWQAKLSTYLPTASDKEMTSAFGSVRLAGLFDAYLTSAIFSLDGDSDSRELRVLLERKIAKLIQRR